jgi:hypothetical protein
MPTDVLSLRNGVEVAFAEAGAEDEPTILEFLTHLSSLSRERRFFSAAIDLRAEAHRELIGDGCDHHGLLAWSADLTVVGHAIYIRLPGGSRAEVAVFRDAFATVSVAGPDAIEIEIEIEIEFSTSGWRTADARFQPARS